MHRTLCVIVAFSLFYLPARATVDNGSTWAFPDGTTATASVGSDGSGMTLTVIDAGGFSVDPANAWGQPAIQSSGVTETQGGNEYYATTNNGAHTGKLKKKINGKWVYGRKVHNANNSGKQGRSRGMSDTDKSGWEDPNALDDAAASVPAIVPFGPGDEVTSLPDPSGWMVGH